MDFPTSWLFPLFSEATYYIQEPIGRLKRIKEIGPCLTFTGGQLILSVKLPSICAVFSKGKLFLCSFPHMLSETPSFMTLFYKETHSTWKVPSYVEVVFYPSFCEKQYCIWREYLFWIIVVLPKIIFYMIWCYLFAVLFLAYKLIYMSWSLYIYKKQL